MELSPEDKLPEVFGNKIIDETTVTSMASFIESAKNNLILDMTRSMLGKSDATVRHAGLQKIEIEPRINLKKCVNAAQAKEIPVESRVTYFDP